MNAMISSHVGRQRHEVEGHPWRWLAITGLIPLPVLVGGLFPTTLNAWPVMIAVLIGAGIGGLGLAGVWWSARQGHAILDVFGRHGAGGLTVLWGAWAVVVGMLLLQWTGDLLPAVMGTSSVVVILTVGTLAAVLSLAWRHGHVWPLWILMSTLMAGAVVVTASVVAHGSGLVWHSANAGPCHFSCPIDHPASLAVTWPRDWARLVNVAGLTTATTLMWVPLGGPETADAGTVWSPVGMLVGLVALLELAGYGALAVLGYSRDPVSGFQGALTGPDGWHALAILVLSGGVILWLAAVWTTGPPTILLASRPRHAATAAAALAGVGGAVVLAPRVTSFLGLVGVEFQQREVVMLALAYALAPLVAILVTALAVRRIPTPRRTLTHLPPWLTALVWMAACGVSTRWADGFGWFGVAPWTLPVVAGMSPPADWALPIGMGTGAFLYLILVYIRPLQFW